MDNWTEVTVTYLEGHIDGIDADRVRIDADMVPADELLFRPGRPVVVVRAEEFDALCLDYYALLDGGER